MKSKETLSATGTASCGDRSEARQDCANETANNYRKRRLLTIEQMRAIAAERGGRCLSTEYVSSKDPLEWECARGHRWRARPNNVKFGTWCGVCERERFASLTEMQQLAGARGGRCLSTVCENAHTALEWECAEGHRWLASPGNVKRGTWCRACANQRKRVPLADVQAAAEAKGGRCLSQHYVNAATPLQFECASGHQWWAYSTNVRKGHWCQQCTFIDKRRTMDEIHALAARWGGQCLSEAYTSRFDLLRWRCARGHEWEANVDRMCTSQGCRQCRDANRREAGLERMQNTAAERGGRCLSEAYVTMNDKMEWQCARGHVWSANPARVVAGSWCPNCFYLSRSKHRHKRLKYDVDG